MERRTELKSVRYGSSSKPSTKSTVLYLLATFFLVIHAVKSSAIRDDESTDDNRNLDNNSNGELNFYRYPLFSLKASKSESFASFNVAPASGAL